MLPQVKPTITPEQYLEIDRAAEIRSEYFDGEMFAMTGGTRAHSTIKVNLVAESRRQLKDSPCHVFDSDMRIKIEATGDYAYPDLSVVCGETLVEDDHDDTVLNPVLIAEVLSPSTEAWDRGGKFARYRTISSLKEFLLIAQHEPRVERYQRREDGTWLLTEAIGLDAVLTLTSIDCRIELSELYDKVTFPEGRSGKA